MFLLSPKKSKHVQDLINFVHFYILCHTNFDKFSDLPNIKSDIFPIFKLHMFHMWPILSHSFLKLINGCFVFCRHYH